MYRYIVAANPPDTPNLSVHQDAADTSQVERPNQVDQSHDVQCVRCGATDVALTVDLDYEHKLRCAPGLPCTDAPDIRRRLKPHCPPWCVSAHTESDRGVDLGGWNHWSAKFQTTVHESVSNESDQFTIGVNVWEYTGGDLEPIGVYVTSSVLDMSIDPAQAKQLADTLSTAALLATLQEPADMETLANNVLVPAA